MPPSLVTGPRLDYEYSTLKISSSALLIHKRNKNKISQPKNITFVYILSRFIFKLKKIGLKYHPSQDNSWREHPYIINRGLFSKPCPGVKQLLSITPEVMKNRMAEPVQKLSMSIYLIIKNQEPEFQCAWFRREHPFV